MAASDGDVSALGRAQEEEDSETNSQHFLTQFPVRDLIFGGTRQLQAGSGAGAGQRGVRDECSACLKLLHFECAKAPRVPG